MYTRIFFLDFIVVKESQILLPRILLKQLNFHYLSFITWIISQMDIQQFNLAKKLGCLQSII